MLGNRRLPDDIVNEILSRLPAESLIRFKCVHKSWYVLIKDSKFVAMHLRNHVSRNNDSLQVLLLSQWGRVSRDHASADDVPLRYIVSMLRYDGVVVSLAGKDVDLIGGMHHSLNYISSHCDGIVCFYGYCVEPVIIANPGIRQFRALPASCIPYPEPDDRPSIVALGLGFDIRTNDYKVVRIVEFVSYYNTPANYYDVEVYTLSSNSWRQIDSISSNLYDSIFRLLSSCSYGDYYWVAAKNSYPHPWEIGILSFNFSDELFQFISIPELVSSAENCYSIIEFNGVQALVSYSFESFNIWDMDSSGVRGTWTKLLSNGSLNVDEHITCQPTEVDIVDVLGVTRKSQFLLLLSSGQVASFNLLTNQMKLLPIDREDKYYDGVDYKSSLVSIHTI